LLLGVPVFARIPEPCAAPVKKKKGRKKGKQPCPSDFFFSLFLSPSLFPMFIPAGFLLVCAIELVL
jgi:hypothetical protein